MKQNQYCNIKWTSVKHQTVFSLTSNSERSPCRAGKGSSLSKCCSHHLNWTKIIYFYIDRVITHKVHFWSPGFQKTYSRNIKKHLSLHCELNLLTLRNTPQHTQRTHLQHSSHTKSFLSFFFCQPVQPLILKIPQVYISYKPASWQWQEPLS